MRHTCLLALAAVLAACASPAGPPAATPDAATAADAAPGGPTWSGQIAPLFAQHCTTCHQYGGVGTFRLDDLATARQWGKFIKQEVQNRT